jgi:hypothetical protein
MRIRHITAFVAAIGFLMLSSPLFAHHGSAQFDIGKRVTLKGTVTEWFWTNPHCLLSFDVTGDDGKVVHWVAETQNGAAIAGDGYSKQTFKPGDEVTITLEPVKNGRPLGRLVEVVLPSGKKLEGGFLNSKSDIPKK